MESSEEWFAKVLKEKQAKCPTKCRFPELKGVIKISAEVDRAVDGSWGTQEGEEIHLLPPEGTRLIESDELEKPPPSNGEN